MSNAIKLEMMLRSLKAQSRLLADARAMAERGDCSPEYPDLWATECDITSQRIRDLFIQSTQDGWD